MAITYVCQKGIAAYDLAVHVPLPFLYSFKQWSRSLKSCVTSHYMNHFANKTRMCLFCRRKTKPQQLRIYK